MKPEEKKSRLAAIENEQNIVVNEKTKEIVSTIIDAFHCYSDCLEDKDYRLLSDLSGLSVGTLHAWFPKNQAKSIEADGSRKKQKEDPEKKIDGPRMINVIRGACLVNIALPDILSFTKESPRRYDEMPNAWNVFIQNLKSMRRVVLEKRNNALREIGWVTSDMKEEDAEYTRKLTSQAGKISKYYNKIVKNNSADYEEGGIHIGKLLGNPNCELRTILMITHCLNKDIKFSKWFQRWGADETIREGREQIVLYDDEKEKLPIIAPYIVGDKRDAMMAVRVGTATEMERKYSDSAVSQVREPKIIARMRDVEVLGAIRKDRIYICNWKQLFRERCVQEGDLIIAFPVKKKVFQRPQILAFNLSMMSNDEIVKELKKAEVQDLFKNIWLSPKDSGREYDVRPDNESLEEFYQNDPLWIYHSEDERETQEFYSQKFAAVPDNRYREILQSRQELPLQDWVIGGSVNVTMDKLLEVGPESMEVKRALYYAKSKSTMYGRMLMYAEKLSPNIDPELSPKPADSVRVARFVRTAQSELRLSIPPLPSVGNDIVLSRQTASDYTFGIHRQKISKMELPIASWTKKSITERLADKAGDILMDSRNPRFTVDFVESYKERIRKTGIDELVRQDRLWLEMLFPTNLEGRVEWYWHMEIPRID